MFQPLVIVINWPVYLTPPKACLLFSCSKVMERSVRLPMPCAFFIGSYRQPPNLIILFIIHANFRLYAYWLFKRATTSDRVSHENDKGMSNAQIRTMGRWKCDAFLRYIRIPCRSPFILFHIFYEITLIQTILLCLLISCTLVDLC